MQERKTATARSTWRPPGAGMLWLILATIFAHALLPVGSPTATASGSAFSASTGDVSLAPARGGASALHTMQGGGSSDGLGSADPGDFPAAGLAWPALAFASAGGAAPLHPVGPDQRGRPARTLPYAPRAPPLT